MTEFLHRLAIAYANASGNRQPASNGAELILLLHGGGERALRGVLEAL